MTPVLEDLGLDPEGVGPQLLIEALRSLSGRLALKLLSTPSQVRGALGMALSRLFMEAYGLLSDNLVIPLDAHPELASGSDPLAPALRSDLLFVSGDPVQRSLDFLVVETKCHRGEGLGAELRQRIAEQIDASQQRLTALFAVSEDHPPIDQSLRSWKLSTVLNFYLNRSQRYGLLSQAAAPALRGFFRELDRGYVLSTRKLGLVFRLDGEGIAIDRDNPDLPIWIVGREAIQSILRSAMQRFAARGDIAEGEAKQAKEGAKEDTIAPPASFQTIRDSGEPTWEDVRRSFIGPRASMQAIGSRAKHSDEKRSSAKPLIGKSVTDLPSVERSDAPDHAKNTVTNVLGGSVTPDEPLVNVSDRPLPIYEVLLGETRATPQYGLLGVVSAEPWRNVAFDLNGCNTLSVFGVQGSGKSYTLGSIIEMATRPIPNINCLPKPLAAVVFHYHQTQDYPPEFTSMVEPNNSANEIEALHKMSAEPVALDDVVVLTTSDTLEQRQREFPAVRVAKIGFSSAELGVADWRFLMGATGNDALYLRLIDEVMRQNRNNLTLGAIRQGLSSAPLSDSQRNLARTRLDFASRFVDDGRSLRGLIRPGRLHHS